jgi:hypothetical protein
MHYVVERGEAARKGRNHGGVATKPQAAAIRAERSTVN